MATRLTWAHKRRLLGAVQISARFQPVEQVNLIEPIAADGDFAVVAEAAVDGVVAAADVAVAAVAEVVGVE